MVVVLVWGPPLALVTVIGLVLWNRIGTLARRLRELPVAPPQPTPPPAAAEDRLAVRGADRGLGGRRARRVRAAAHGAVRAGHRRRAGLARTRGPGRDGPRRRDRRLGGRRSDAHPLAVGRIRAVRGR